MEWFCLCVHYSMNRVCFPFCLSCEKLWVDLRDCQSPLPVSISICLALDFHFSSSAVHAEPHEQTDVERAEESEGCALSGRSKQCCTALIQIYLFILLSSIFMYHLWSYKGLQPFNETDLPNRISMPVEIIDSDDNIKLCNLPIQ